MEAVVRLGDLAAGERAALDARSPMPFHATAFAAAFETAGAHAVVVRVEEEHAFFLESSVAGFVTWTGLASPTTATPAMWNAILAAGRARGVVSARWRDPGLTRVDETGLTALQRACAEAGARCATTPIVSRVLDLTRPIDEVFARVHGAHRTSIRHARLAGVVVKSADRGRFPETFARLSAATWARSGMEAPSPAYYAALLREPRFLPFLARDADGDPVAGAIDAVGKAGALGLHAGSSNTVQGASTLLHWAAIEELHARGVPSYDLGGDPVPGAPDDSPRAAGIRRFKQRFGGEAQTWWRIHVVIDPAGYHRAKAALAKNSTDPR